MKNITIIGAGLGGLTAGALLAKRGEKVILLEQHNIVGGCATTFNRKGGFTCEVGLHEMDGVYDNPSLVKIFDELKVYDNVKFLKINEFFKIHSKHGTFVMPDGIENVLNTLKIKFPEEKNGIKKYFKLIEKIAKSYERLVNLSWYEYLFFPFLFWDILYYKSKSVNEVLNKLIFNDELKLILNANVQYYNDTPDTLSFLLHAIAQHSYYSGGGYFIKGGSGRLSDYFAEVIRENGGEIITSANVVACHKNEVEYIHKKERKTIPSDMVISNLSPQQSYELYDTEYTETRPLGNSLLTIYLGFNKNLKTVYGEGVYSNYIVENLASVDDFATMMRDDIEYRGFVFLDYSQVDSGLTKDDEKSFGVITMMDSIEMWESLDEETYKKRKNSLIEITLNKLEKHYPNITQLVEYAEVGTAKTVKRYIKTPNGTAYGFKPTTNVFFRIPKVKSEKIKNLYFVGQWVIAGGFSPAIMSGGLCVQRLEKELNK